MIRYDGHYLSDKQEHIRYENGRQQTEDYWLLYQFYPDGTWICKTADSPDFDLEGFLFSLEMESIRSNPHKNEPMLENRELVYQSGTWEEKDGWINIEWRNTHLGEDPRRWTFRIVNEDLLTTALGEWELRFVGRED